MIDDRPSYAKHINNMKSVISKSYTDYPAVLCKTWEVVHSRVDAFVNEIWQNKKYENS